jgi:hypothetical protein
MAASSDITRPLGGRDVIGRVFSFPNPVNEVSARLVASCVVLLGLVAIGFEQPWLTAVIAYGFVARVLTGPTLSPLGQLVTRVITPRLHLAARPVAGPPKRFAQGIGAAFSVSAAVLALGLGRCRRVLSTRVRPERRVEVLVVRRSARSRRRTRDGRPGSGPGTYTGAMCGVRRDYGVNSNNGGQHEHHRPGDGLGSLHRFR